LLMTTTRESLSRFSTKIWPWISGTLLAAQVLSFSIGCGVAELGLVSLLYCDCELPLADGFVAQELGVLDSYSGGGLFTGWKL
jgi:hypothetical protein